MKLPQDIVEKLNELGFGGKTIYVPIIRETELIYRDMCSRIERGENINIHEYRNKVSTKTLYRLKKKAERRMKKC